MSKEAEKAHDLESVWALREEELYPALFGPDSRGIFVLEPEDFAMFGAEPDPRWLFLGVFEFAPTSKRPSWVYVTSGGSTPWEQEPEDYGVEEFSWLGFELMIETTAPGDWAIRLLKRLFAFEVLLAHDHFGDKPGLSMGARFPLRMPIDGAGSALTFVVATAPRCVAPMQSLPSGKFGFLELVGAAETEIEFAKQHGTEVLVECLVAAGAAPITDVNRAPVSLPNE